MFTAPLKSNRLEPFTPCAVYHKWLRSHFSHHISFPFRVTQCLYVISIWQSWAWRLCLPTDASLREEPFTDLGLAGFRHPQPILHHMSCRLSKDWRFLSLFSHQCDKTVWQKWLELLLELTLSLSLCCRYRHHHSYINRKISNGYKHVHCR